MIISCYNYQDWTTRLRKGTKREFGSSNWRVPIHTGSALGLVICGYLLKYVWLFYRYRVLLIYYDIVSMYLISYLLWYFHCILYLIWCDILSMHLYFNPLYLRISWLFLYSLLKVWLVRILVYLALLLSSRRCCLILLTSMAIHI